MPIVPVGILGPTYQSRSTQFSSQATENLYPEVEQAGRNGSAWMPWPGTSEFAAFTGTDRGMHVFRDLLYKVSGDRLLSVDANGTIVDIGRIAGSRQCIFADDGDTMVIVTDGHTYTVNRILFLAVFAEFDNDELLNTQSVTVLNRRFIYDTGLGGRFAQSDVADPRTIQSNNTAVAESDGDSLVRPYAFQQTCYMMGEKTIEPHFDDGVSNPSLLRIDRAIIQVGLGAIHSVANSDSFLYFLGDDLNIYQLTGNQARVVSNAAIAGEIQGFDTTDDAVGYACNFQGQNFYILTFPSANKTYCYSETINDTFLLTTEGDRYLGNSYAFFAGKHLLGDYRSGSVIQWDFDLFTDLGQPIIRRRRTHVLSGEAIGEPRSRILMRWFELMCQVGLGLPDDQGSDPKVMVRISLDGGHSFETQLVVPIGKAGEFTQKIRADHMASAYDFVVEITFSEPVFFSLQGASASIEAYGF